VRRARPARRRRRRLGTSTPLIAIPAVYAHAGRGIPMVFEVRDLWRNCRFRSVLEEPAYARGASSGALAYSNSAALSPLSPGMAEGIVRTGYLEKKWRWSELRRTWNYSSATAAQGRAFRRRPESTTGRILVVIWVRWVESTGCHSWCKWPQL